MNVTVDTGTLTLDTLLVRPYVSRLVLAGSGGRTELVHSAAPSPQPTSVGENGTDAHVEVYDAPGTLVRGFDIRGERTVVLPVGGFAIIQR